MNRLLDAIDAWANENALNGEVPPPERFASTRIEASPDHSWLEVPVFDRKGAGEDARELSAHLGADLGSRAAAPAPYVPRLAASRTISLPILPIAGRG